MENKIEKYTFTPINTDISPYKKEKDQSTTYLKNFRLISNNEEHTAALVNEKGLSLKLTLPDVTYTSSTNSISYLKNDTTVTIPLNNLEIAEDYNAEDKTISNHKIIGWVEVRNGFVIITTDNNGGDIVWFISDNIEPTVLYVRDLNLSSDNLIQMISNYENEKIEKVYWVDGKNQLRYLNIKHSIANGDLEEIIDIPKESINQYGGFKLSKIDVSNSIHGGNHTAGMIQYAYSLYRINGSETPISPLSELVSLDKITAGGGEVNEIVGKSPIVRISNIDPNYTNIKIYAIKYTSLNETPSVSIIEDAEIPSNGTLQIIDTGDIIQTISLEEFLFLGNDSIIAKNIVAKDNRLFYSNYKEKLYDLDVDVRCYSFDSSGSAIIYSNLIVINEDTVTGTPLSVDSDYNIPITHPAVNLDYDIYKFQSDGVTLGGEGKYFKYELTSTSAINTSRRYFKDEEVYRIGIKFSKNGRFSEPKWIADFRAPEGNLLGNYNILRFNIKPSFYTFLDTLSANDKPDGYMIVVAERTESDKTIVANGIVNPMMMMDINRKDVRYPQDKDYVKERSSRMLKMPNFLFRNFSSSGNPTNIYPMREMDNYAEMSMSRSTDTEIMRAEAGDRDTFARFYQYNAMFQLYSPESIFDFRSNLTSNLKFKIKGGVNNTYNEVWSKELYNDYNPWRELKILNGLHYEYGEVNILLPPQSSIPQPISANNINRNGILSVYSGAARKFRRLFYRQYGVSSTYFSPDVVNGAVNITSPLVSSIEEDESISQIGSNLISVNLLNGQSVKYEVTVTPVTTGDYTITIYSDSAGTNILETSSENNGIETLSYSYTATEDTTLGFVTAVTSEESVLAGMVDFKVTIYQNNDPLDVVVYAISNGNTIFNSYTEEGDEFIPADTKVFTNVLGIPEFSNLGDDYRNYNYNSEFRYANTYTSLQTDGDGNSKILSMLSDNSKNITVVLGDNNTNIEDRIPLEVLATNSGLKGDNLGIIGELFKPKSQIYAGTIYGGWSYEDKKRTRFLDIGQINNIFADNVLFTSPGDTYVQVFQFARITPKDIDIEDSVQFIDWGEIVSVPCETTVDLKNRNDLSIGGWDLKFLPKDEDFHQYNKVYSQNNILSLSRASEYNIKKNRDFDTRIIASKLKYNGELYDNWLTLSVNDTMDLEGTYGGITNLIKFKDNIFAIQERAVSVISINPRIQIATEDTIGLELGSGQVLDNYKYLSTTSGSRHKWSTIITPHTFYYYDAFNNGLYRLAESLEETNKIKGFNSYFKKNINPSIYGDNPVNSNGIAGGYDYIYNDVHLSFIRNTAVRSDHSSIAFNEAVQGFLLYDYHTPMFITKPGLSLNVIGKNIYKMFDGEYNNFYGTYRPSKVTLLLNPTPDVDTVFNNLHYTSDVFLNNVEIPTESLTKIRLYNEYQDSGNVNLINSRNGNMKRFFREWKVELPRNANSRQRIRSPWAYVDLIYESDQNKRIRLNDILLYYSN